MDAAMPAQLFKLVEPFELTIALLVWLLACGLAMILCVLQHRIIVKQRAIIANQERRLVRLESI